MNIVNLELSKSQWEDIGKKAGWTKVSQSQSQYQGEFIPKVVQDIANRIPSVNHGTSVISVGKGSPSAAKDSYNITFSCAGLTKGFCEFISELNVDCAVYARDGNYVLLIWFNW